jgi:hypothetical protein
MGLTGAQAQVDPDALKARIEAIEHKLEHGVRHLLDSQGVRIRLLRLRFGGILAHSPRRMASPLIQSAS